MPPESKKARVDTEEVEDNRIRFHVKDISKVRKEGVISSTKIIGRFPWAMRVKCRFDRFVPSFEVLLLCQKESRFWRCTVVKPKCIIINQEGGEDYCPNSSFSSSDDEDEDEEEETLVFSTEENEKRVLLFYGQLQRILREGSIKNDSIIFEMRIEIKQKKGVKRSGMGKTVDMLSPSVLFDCALKMGETKIYVSRQFLALHSGFFKALFFGDFKEASQSEVEMVDVDPEDFHELLTILYKMGGSIDENNVDAMLKLADRFEIQCILADCESFLLVDKTIAAKDSLFLADQYNLAQLKEKCITKFSSVASVALLRATPGFSDLSAETHRLLLDRVLALSGFAPK